MELIDITSQCTSVQSHSSGNLKSITKIAYSSYFAEMLHFWLYLTGLPTSRTFQAFSLIISSVDCFWKYWKKKLQPWKFLLSQHSSTSIFHFTERYKLNFCSKKSKKCVFLINTISFDAKCSRQCVSQSISRAKINFWL